MEPPRMPVARELFAQWRRNRGDRSTVAARPFSRGWEPLLEDAGIVSATDRQDAVRDARELAREGWVELKAIRYRATEIDRVVVPFTAEERWCRAFGFVPAAEDPDAGRMASHAWQPTLAFVRDARIGLPFEELARIDAFLANRTSSETPSPFVPLKERSLELFGDEKRLDALLATALFREDRLTLEHLRCFAVPEPLGWQRGRHPDGPVIVLENLSTWHTYVEWDKARPQFSAVIYGGGNRFIEGVVFLRQIFAELGGPREIRYFGDLDPAGLRIPRRAGRVATAAGLPAVEPHRESYHWLLGMTDGASPGEAIEEATGVRDDCGWLGELAGPAWEVIASGKRLAQERVGCEFLLSAGGPGESGGARERT